jgi:hypothetical protein
VGEEFCNVHTSLDVQKLSQMTKVQLDSQQYKIVCVLRRSFLIDYLCDTDEGVVASRH